jgi:hypothetical protein
LLLKRNQIGTQRFEHNYFSKTSPKCTMPTMQEAKSHLAEDLLQDVPIIGATEAALWERLLNPASADLSPEAARYILNLCFPQQDTDRMHELAEKARAGTLSIEEHVEMDNYERVGHVLSLMKSKARKSLKKTRAAN